MTSLHAVIEFRGEFGQDKILNEILFKDKNGGVFIDIGAHDGMSGSNTWYFEKKLGWKGICFEPVPDIFNRLIMNRSCMCINACVSDKDGMVVLRQVIGAGEMYSGIESNYDSRHREKIEEEIAANRGSSVFLEVPAYKLNTVLAENAFWDIDFLSLDIEGGELEVLKSIDFNTFYIASIAVENNYEIPEMRSYLESQNFRFIERLGVDEIYINNKEFQKKTKKHEKKKQQPVKNHPVKDKERRPAKNKQSEVGQAMVIQNGQLLLVINKKF